MCAVIASFGGVQRNPDPSQWSCFWGELHKFWVGTINARVKYLRTMELMNEQKVNQFSYE
jgi:hypothetical protein